MQDVFDITVENKLETEKRDLNVYHHSTLSAHIISLNSSITLPLRTADPLGEKDYLLVSVVGSPGDLGEACSMDIPSWIDFEFTSKGKVTVITIVHTHNRDGDRILIKIPPGPPAWELKITKPAHLSLNGPLTFAGDRVTIGDDGNKI